jgi:hypothetical protein
LPTITASHKTFQNTRRAKKEKKEEDREESRGCGVARNTYVRVRLQGDLREHLVRIRLSLRAPP